MTGLAMDDRRNESGNAADDRQSSDMHRRQRGKNIALGLALAGAAVLFYVVAIVKMSGG